jgi:hypothetical protein
MTQIERYRHLLQHWLLRAEDAREELRLAGDEVTKWRNKLYAAEIAEKLAVEEKP